MKAIERNKAMAIASDWHGGQSSALYSFASTGFVIQGDLPKYITEIDTNLNGNQLKKGQVKYLEQLRRYLEMATGTLKTNL